MKKIISQCIAAYLIAALGFGGGAAYAFTDDDDQWGDFDASQPLDAIMAEPPPPPEPEPSAFDAFDAFDGFAAPSDPAPSFEEFAVEPQPEPEPAQPLVEHAADDLDDDIFLMPLGDGRATVDASAAGFISVIRHPPHALSDFQNAVIEGLQVTVEESATVEDEILVTCYFIFRDRPTSYFYDLKRNEKKLVFEFVDTRTGSSPLAALQQAPIREVIIDELQVDANKDIKGIAPEWHDMIRITFHLDDVPVVSVSDESNIISFKYKWTTRADKIPQYLMTDKFPLVFWISGGVLGAIGIGTLTYFLMPKKDDSIDPRLSPSDLPARPGLPSRPGVSKSRMKRGKR